MFYAFAGLFMAIRVGLAMLQGARHEHAQAIIAASKQLDLNIKVISLRTASDLRDGIDCLILPGGETTAMRIASKSERLYTALFEWMKDNPNSPVLGTCAGAILMCQLGEETDSIIDAVISRNSYGRQKESFQADVQISGLPFDMKKEFSNEMAPTAPSLDNSFKEIIGETSANHRPLNVSSSLIESNDEHIFPGIFIRAPRFGQIGENVGIIATNGDEIVGVLEGNKMALTFHPELTSDYRFHRWLLQKSNDRVDY
jgi:5'-phosphate synthase pdxT subunit